MHVGFDEEECWEVKWITSSRFFMQALRGIMPEGSIVYLESYDECSEFLPFIAKNRCEPDLRESVYEACSDPAPTWTEHLVFGESLVDSIDKFFSSWNFSYADHVCGYHEGDLLFWFHDAFEGGTLEISPRFPKDQIMQFCRDLAPKFRRRSRI